MLRRPTKLGEPIRDARYILFPVTAAARNAAYNLLLKYANVTSYFPQVCVYGVLALACIYIDFVSIVKRGGSSRACNVCALVRAV